MVTSSKVGKIIINADEWTLSDAGYQQAPDTDKFVQNIANWFTGGKPGKFHGLSTNFGLTQGSIARSFASGGHTWTTGVNIPLTLESLRNYDGIFLGGDKVDSQLLIDYVNAGGNVYVMAGTGWGGAVVEANNWNPFLTAFGLKFAGQYNNITGKLSISDKHPIFAGVQALYTCNGNSITDLEADNPTNQIVLRYGDDQGLIAIYEGKPIAPAKVGKIVINADEWTLSDAGYQQAPDTDKFVQNIANWFTGGKPGKFHGLSTNFGLTQGSIARSFASGGHTWTTGVNIPLTLESLRNYDGIFLGGDKVDSQLLIDYVKTGGNVYVMAGTGWGGAVVEANNWNPFLVQFGLQFAGQYNNITGKHTVNYDHPIFAGVQALYTCNGNSITDLEVDNPTNQIVLRYGDNQGLIAIYEGKAITVPDLSGVLNFDGNGQCVEVPYHEAHNPATFTLSAWVKVTGGQGTWRSVITSRDADPTRGFIIYGGQDNKWQTWVGNGQSSNGWMTVTGTEIVLNTWTHVAATFDGTVLKLYINGKLSGEKAVTYAVNTCRPLRIASGATEVAGRYFYHGKIAEVSVWNVAKVEAEISQIMTYRLRGQEAGLVGYWPLNECSGQTATDRSTFQHHGIIRGATWTQEVLPIQAPPEPAVVEATGGLEITALVYQGKVKRAQSDEYIEVTNKGSTAIDLSGWKVTSAAAKKKQVFTFPNGTSIAAGQSFRVYTNEVHPETGGFSFGSATAVWNDLGDQGQVLDPSGTVVATWSYGSMATPA